MEYIGYWILGIGYLISSIVVSLAVAGRTVYKASSRLSTLVRIPHLPHQAKTPQQPHH